MPRPADDERVRSFRAPLPLHRSPALRWVVGLAVALPWGVGAVVAAGSGELLRAAWHGGVVAVVALGWLGAGRAAPGVDVSDRGVRRRPGGRLVPWADVEEVQERGRWRDEAALRTTSGRSLSLAGAPDDVVALLATAVRCGDGEGRPDVDVLDRVLAGPSAEAGGGRPGGPARRRLSVLVVLAAGSFLAARLAELLPEGSPQDLLVIGATTVGLVAVAAAGFTAVTAQSERAAAP